MNIVQTPEGIEIKTGRPVNMKVVQKIADYIEISEIVAQAQGTEEQAVALASEVNRKWWEANKSRFLPDAE